jgi:hypothetical protein
MARALHSTAAAKQMRRASNRDDAPGGGVHYACDTNHMRSAPFRRPVQRSVNPRASPPLKSYAARPPGAWRVAAGCTYRFYTPHAARKPPTRAAVAFRTAHLHSGPIARTNFECAFNAPIIARGNFPTFSDPPNLYGGGLALAGLCSSAARPGLGRPRRRWPRRRRPKRRRRSVPPPHWMDAVSVALRATRAHALSGDICLIRTLRCVRPPPCDCACVRRGDGGDCVCVRIAVVAGSMTPLRARQCGQAGSVL